MEQWITLTSLKTRNQEQGAVMIQYLWCSKIKMRKMILLYLLRIKMTAKINGLLIQSLNVKRFFLFVNEIADNFTPGNYKVPENITQLRQEEYNAWCISRHIKPISDSEKNKIPSFVGIKSLLS